MNRCYLKVSGFLLGVLLVSAPAITLAACCPTDMNRVKVAGIEWIQFCLRYFAVTCSKDETSPRRTFRMILRAPSLAPGGSTSR